MDIICINRRSLESLVIFKSEMFLETKIFKSCYFRKMLDYIWYTYVSYLFWGSAQFITIFRSK